MEELAHAHAVVTRLYPLNESPGYEAREKVQLLADY